MLNGGQGLTLIKKQTIGTAVTSVNVTGAFSSTYNTYAIMISDGVASTNAGLRLQLGATTTGYYNNTIGISAGAGVFGGNDFNIANFNNAGQANTSQISLNLFLTNPFLSKVTAMTSQSTGSTVTSPIFAVSGGQLNNTLSYTDFTISPSTGTLTGGTIYVYGYGKGQ